MRPTLRIAPEDSLARAAAELRRNGGVVIPVVERNILRGIVTDRSLALAMAEGVEVVAAVTIATIPAETIAPYATGAEALRRLADGDGLPLVVVDDMGRPMGIISAADLYPNRSAAARPAAVGGMATPFGVYLTNGSVQGGAGGYKLMGTGATLMTIMIVGQWVVGPALDWAGGSRLSQSTYDAILAPLLTLFLLVVMRLIPLSGTHGAEHQVVHAIERGEELTPEVVRRMPRVHPRCGTNLVAGASIFFGVVGITWIESLHLRLLLAAVLTVAFWRPFGSFLQQYITTRPPSDKQLADGICAGNQLLERYAASHVAVAPPLRRIWNSGLFHVMAGSFLTAIVAEGIGKLFHVELGLLST